MNIQNKIALVIGASIESLIAIRYAKNLGLKVVAFDGDESALGLKEADISYIVDITKPELIISKLKRDGLTPSLILPVPIGRTIVSIGALNEYYHLDSFGYKIADICSDKLKFASALIDNGGGVRLFKRYKI
ncbi:hypothetical protein [Campylobacter lanienae]|uniref:hypothetical protein n=1 Tax=Campylobacter lanienae TaxID=75658 RepID=UPI000BB433DF|nr:hypothetical protein [Campylobacter lanienae]